MSDLSQQEVATKARALTTQAEHFQNVSGQLNAIPVKDRVRIAHEMESDNLQDLKSDNSLPKLEFDFVKEHVNTPQEKWYEPQSKYWTGPEHLMHIEAAGKNHTAVYTMPDKAEKQYEYAGYAAAHLDPVPRDNFLQFAIAEDKEADKNLENGNKK
jgi:hypothetical protein